MPLEDPPEAIKVALLDRISHPVMGVAILALAICNWQPVVYLAISEEPATARINAALGYVTYQTLFLVPLAITAVWVLLGPILKVLALMYDGYVSNWEKVRAYKAALRVVERNTAEAANALKQVEAELVAKRVDLGTLSEQHAAKVAALKESTEALELVAKVGTPGWQSNFMSGGKLPLQPGTEAHAKAKARFELLEKVKQQVLGPSA